MTAIRLARTELLRLTSSRLGRLAVVAMILVPSLYGGLYLWANRDPYAALDHVPAAVVDEDAGTALATGERLQVGSEVADGLVRSHSFDWHRVTRGEARDGLEDGRYSFVLVIPSGFSGDLASSADFTPRQAMLELDTNDANGYLSRTIANTVVAEVTKNVASQVTRTAATQLLKGFADIHAEVADASKGAQQLADGLASAKGGSAALASGADRLVAGERQLVTGTNALASGADRLDDGLHQLRSATSGLPARTRALADGAAQVADGNAKVAATSAVVATATTAFVEDMTTSRGDLATRLRAAGFDDAQVARVLAAADGVARPLVEAQGRVQTANGQLQALATGSRQVASGARALADASTGLSSGIATAAAGSSELSSGAQRLRAGQADALSGAEQLSRGAHELDTGLGRLAPGATRLSQGLASGAKRIPDPSDAQRTAVAQTLGNPVAVRGVSDATAANYGAGLAPFFMSLALWIGGFVLFTRVRPLSDRAIVAGQRAWRVALGGWLAPAVLGVVQAALAYGIVAFGLGIRAAHPVLLLGFMALVSMTFMMVIHALMARFGLVGQFGSLVVMVLQLVSAGGTFPWQTLPLPLQWLHHVLPMSYTVDGIRRLMYGGSMVHLGLDLAVLGTWAAAAFALGTVGARRAGTWTAKRIKPEVQPA